MTAVKEREGGGLHKQWLERKLEIEVGRVTAKLQSKGLTIPEPNAVALEAGVRLAQAHLPKLSIDLYGRNPNGTVKVVPPPPRPGPPKPPTVVQKLDSLMQPTQLTPLPTDVAAAHGRPLSLPLQLGKTHVAGGSHRSVSPPGQPGRPGVQLPPHHLPPPHHLLSSQQLSASLTKQERHTADGQAGGAGAMVPPAHTHRAHGSFAVEGGEAGGGGGGGAGASGGGGRDGSPRTARSAAPPSASQFRPDLQGADARIDEALVEVQRVAMQANEMSPRARVVYLARQVNPEFELTPPAHRLHRSATHTTSRLRRELTRKSTRKLTTCSADSGAAAGASGGEGLHQHESPQPTNTGARRFQAWGKRKDPSFHFKPEGYLPPLPDARRSVEHTPSAVSARGSRSVTSNGDASGHNSLPPLKADRRHGADAHGAQKEGDPAHAAHKDGGSGRVTQKGDGSTAHQAERHLGSEARGGHTEGPDAHGAAGPAGGDAHSTETAGADKVPLPALPPRHSHADPLSSFNESAANTLVALWEGAAAEVLAEQEAAAAAEAAALAAAAEAAEAPAVSGHEHGD